MKPVKLLVIPGVLITLLAALLLGVSSTHISAHAAAAIASKCGAWSVVKSPDVGKCSAFNAVAVVSENDVWAVGSVFMTTNGAEYDTLVEHWNDKHWQVVSSLSSINVADVLEGVRLRLRVYLTYPARHHTILQGTKRYR